MPTTNFRILFAACLGVALAAQESALPQTPSTDVEAFGGGRDDGWRTLQNLPEPQEPGQDYSWNALFQQEYGDFMLKRARFAPQVLLRGGAMLGGNVTDEPGNFDLWRGTVDANFRAMISHNAYVSFGAFYDTRIYDTQDMPNFDNETLTSTGLNLGLGWFIDKDVLLELKAKPGYWSDLDATLKSEDVDCWASALATVRYSEEFFFKLGGRYNEIYDDAKVLPYVGVTWAGETIRFDMLLPESIELSLWPTSDFGILFGAEVVGGNYRVRSDVASGRQPGNARVQEVLAYTGIQWQFSDDFGMEIRGGAALAGDYSLEDGNPATQRIDGQISPAVFFDVSFGILF